jgi:hypothetical protein
MKKLPLLALFELGFICSLLAAIIIYGQEVNPTAPNNGALPNPPAESATAASIAWVLSTATNIVGQTVAWGLSPTNYQFFVNVPRDRTQYQITGLLPGTTYYVSVYCTQNVGSTTTNLVRSFYANEVVITTLPTMRPEPPTNVKLISQP